MSSRRKPAGIRPYCNVCRRHYRGLYGVHASTATHIKYLHRGGRQSAGTKRERTSSGRRVMTAARLHYLQARADAAKVRVKHHRRSPAYDGGPSGPATTRTVPVDHYWRDPPSSSLRGDPGHALALGAARWASKVRRAAVKAGILKRDGRTPAIR